MDFQTVLKTRLEKIIYLLNAYDWLLDSFVVEFFTDKHWDKLPPKWQSALGDISGPEILGKLLDPASPLVIPSPKKDEPPGNPWPLSLLAFRGACHALALPRSSKDRLENPTNPKVIQYTDEIDHLYRKHVKPKKQHEIVRLAKLIDEVSRASDSGHVIDFGAGKGHLSRLLSYIYGKRVTCIEAEDGFSCGARKYDDEVVKGLRKKKQRQSHDVDETSLRTDLQPRHITLKLHPDISASEFGDAVRYDATTLSSDSDATSVMLPSKRPKEDDSLVIAGLHACGDLSTAMLRLFVQSPSAVGLVSVACCYMKLSERAGASCKHSQDAVGYPMSRAAAAFPKHRLSYEAKELSCHALEVYSDRLKEELPRLRVHCHRAALEVLIREVAPHLVKPQVRGGKKLASMHFFEYAQVSMSKLGLDCNLSSEKRLEVAAMLEDWRSVVVHYTLRLLMAPLVESCILLDRLLYLAENGVRRAWIEPIFEPRVSPRNFAIVALKNK